MAQLILIKTATLQSHVDDLVGMESDGTFDPESIGYRDLNVYQVPESKEQIQIMIDGIEKIEDAKYHVNVPGGDLTQMKACTG